MKRQTARIFADLRPHRRYALWVLGGTLVYACARAVPPLLARVLLDRTLSARAASVLGVDFSVPTAIVVIPLLLLLLAGTLALAQYLMRLWSGVLGQRLVGDLQARLLEHLLRVPTPLLERRLLGTQLLRFNSDMGSVKRFVSRSLPSLLRDAVAVLVICAVLLVLHLTLGLILTGVVVGYLVLSAGFWHRLADSSRAVRTARTRVSGMAFDRLAVAAQVKLMGRERTEVRRFRRVQQRVLDVSRAQARVFGWVSGLSELAVGLLTAVSLGVGAWAVLSDALSRGELVAVYGLVLMLMSPLRSLSRTLESLAVGQVAFDRLYGKLDAPEERDSRGAVPLEVTEGRVSLEGVRVADARYPDVMIPPGVTLVLGSPGNGVSLLGPLLVRLQHPAAGTIRIDGTDVAMVELRSLRRTVSYIPAMAPLLKGSLRLNLTAGLSVEDPAVVVAALHAVGGTWAGPDTLDRPAGSAGRLLSPVQRWQVLCARAYLSQPAIVVLDGPPVGSEPLNVAIGGLREAGVRTLIVLSEHDLPVLQADRTISFAPVETARA